MQLGSLQPYEQALSGSAPIQLVSRDGRVLDLEVHKWLADADPADQSVLDRCLEPTLDVGCGPGRMVRALYARGVAALGVDIAPVAVALSNVRGGPALVLDVFDRVPAEGGWSSILLLDGNIGIGGDVERLLRRVADLLAPAGSVVVEASPWPMAAGVQPMRFRRGGLDVGVEFPWAIADLDTIETAGRSVGLTYLESWHSAGRGFLRLARP